ncbi:AEC family transporter [Variovorax sp. VNK109]|uniref:AEC family transporter n=1 Tax=Variovorax sp. VNK109 TaxID=3400919 RepID=UPI003BFCFE7A
MSDVLSITLPIYIVIAIGFACARAGWFSRADMRVFGKFVIQLALPALLFNALSSRTLAEVINPVYLVAYTAGSLLVAGIGFAWARWAGKSLSGAAVVAMGMTCSNSGFIGFPLALQLFGPTAGVALALCMIVENVLMLPLLLAIADMDGAQGKGNWRKTFLASLAGLVRNPMILAIIAGLVFSLFGLRLPEAGARAVNLFATSCGALALFVIGGSLTGTPTPGLKRDVSAIAIGKLLLHPLAVFVMLWLLPPLPAQLHVAALIFAAVPMLGIYPILAQKHGHDGMAAVAQLFTTVISFVTLTALIWALQHRAL